MRWLKNGEFYAVYEFNDDTMTFNVIGPVYEGDDIDERTGVIRDQGRNVHISVSPPQDDPRGFHPENFIDQVPEGYKYDPHMRW